MPVTRVTEVKFFSVVLTWPPSQNESLMPGPKGGLIKTKKSRDWFAEAEKVCAAAHTIGSVFPVEEVVLHITLFPPSRRPDIDNGVKKVMDAMSEHAYHDDRQVAWLIVQKADVMGPENAFIQARVWEVGRTPGYLKETLELPW